MQSSSTRTRHRATLDTAASDKELVTLLRLTERYCAVLQTIAGSPAITAEVTSG